MRISTVVLLAALTASCGGDDEMTRRERYSELADGRVGRDWSAKVKSQHAPDAGIEQGDEIRWGATVTADLFIPLNQPGAFFSTRTQLVQIERPARTWSIQLATTFLNPQTPVNPGELIDSFFLIDYGTGASKIHTLETQQMVMPPVITDWMPQPIVVTTLPLKPAKQIIITAFCRFFTVAVATPARHIIVKLDASAAPVER